MQIQNSERGIREKGRRKLRRNFFFEVQVKICFGDWALSRLQVTNRKTWYGCTIKDEPSQVTLIERRIFLVFGRPTARLILCKATLYVYLIALYIFSNPKNVVREKCLPILTRAPCFVLVISGILAHRTGICFLSTCTGISTIGIGFTVDFVVSWLS